MVRVVGEDNKHVKEVSCRNCAARLQYTENETRRAKINMDWTGDYDWAYGIDCPKCSSFVKTR